MPFYRMDPAMYDEMVDEIGADELPPEVAANRPTGEFEYHAAEGRFDAVRLGLTSRLALRALIDLGATGFRVRYDGGYDEGFAHADAVLFASTERPVDAVAKDLATPAFTERVRMAGGAAHQSDDRSVAGEQLTRATLDELAYELASILLGGGFGTGEYELYGAFTADLKSGAITDDPDARAAPRKG